MKALRKISLLCIIGLVLLYLGSLESAIPLFGQQANCDAAAQKDFVLRNRLLPSLTDFGVFGKGEFDLLGILDEIKQQTPQFKFTIPVYSHTSGPRFYTVTISPASIFEDTRNPTNLIRIFRGKITEPDLRDSTVALYIQDYQHSKTSLPGFISGYLLESLADPSAAWYFIEPVRPLLKLRKNVDPKAIDANLPPECFPHIVYETRDTNFNIKLDPTILDQATATHQELKQEQLQGRLTTIAAPATVNVPIVAVADPEFQDAYTISTSEKAWRDAQKEVINLVDDFYRNELMPDLDFHLKLRSQPVWFASGYGSDFLSIPNSPISAYHLLCANVLTPPLPHDHGSLPVLVHLFSGREFQPIPAKPDPGDDPMKVSVATDSGPAGHICPGPCGTIANTVVGLAEGIGGYRGSSPEACAKNIPAQGPLYPFDFIPSAHHSTSQQTPKLISDPENTNYDVILYQRFLLLAHELGHNLGAIHATDDSTSIMHGILDPMNRYVLDNDSKTKILNCVLTSANPC